MSVIRPKKHSLHPGDLQLIFNMIFEADGVKAGGGDSWIPVCLPGFNNSGYLYMYVSFLDLRGDESHVANQDTNKDDSVAIILISPDKESFYVLREMRDSVVEVINSSFHSEPLFYPFDKLYFTKELTTVNSKWRKTAA